MTNDILVESDLEDAITISRVEWDRLRLLAELGAQAAGLVHELNNILTPVLGYVRLAEAYPSDPVLTMKALGRASQGVQDVTQIAASILQATKADSDQITNIKNAADAALAATAPLISAGKFRVQIDIPSELDVRIGTAALRQIFVNLITNACRAMTANGAVGITAAEQGPWVEIVFADDGPGLPDDVRTTFERPSSWYPSRAGHGLGLMVCRRLAEQAQGQLDVLHSEIGSAFRLTLRCANHVPDARTLEA